RGERPAALGARRHVAPELHVSAFVVAHPRLGADVAEHDLDLAVGRRGGGEGVELAHPPGLAGPGARPPRARVPLVADRDDDRVLEALAELVERDRARLRPRVDAHRAAPASSTTFGARSVRASSHTKTFRGTISITARSKNNGSATRLPRKKSI